MAEVRASDRMDGNKCGNWKFESIWKIKTLDVYIYKVYTRKWSQENKYIIVQQMINIIVGALQLLKAVCY